jgi:hypothetical protein
VRIIVYLKDGYILEMIPRDVEYVVVYYCTSECATIMCYFKVSVIIIRK